MVAVPLAVARPGPVELLRAMVKVSFASSITSPSTGTVSDLWVAPFGKKSVPWTAV